MAISKLGETAPGYLFFGMNGGGIGTKSPVIMTQDGQLVWRSEEDFQTTVFRVQQYRNESVLTYYTGNDDRPNTGTFVILDQSYNKIHEVCGAAVNINPDSNGTCKLNLHEVRISHRDTLLALGHDNRRANLSFLGGPEDGWIKDNLVFEFDIETDKLLFSWSAWDHRDELPLNMSYNLVTNPNRGFDGTSFEKAYDFQHMNAVDLVGDDYLVSSRFYSSAIMLNSSGNVKWYLQGEHGGSFTLPEDCKFGFQHDIVASSVTNTSMVINMFDNANYQLTRPSVPSSGLELYLDLENYSVSLKRRLMDPEFRMVTQLTGGYQALPNGHGLVNFAIPPWFREFDEDGELVYATQACGGGVYRAYKNEWVGRPTTDPKAAARPFAGNQTKAWASWNGATEVATWVFWAGEEADLLSERIEVPKVLFETSVKFVRSHQFVLAQALDASGHTLGQSAVVAVERAVEHSVDFEPSLQLQTPLVKDAIESECDEVCWAHLFG